MHIRNDPSFFLTNKTGAPQGEELGLIKPLSDSSFSCSDNSLSWYGAIDMVARANRCSKGTKIYSETPLVERRKTPASPKEILQERSRTIGTVFKSAFTPTLVSNFFAVHVPKDRKIFFFHVRSAF
ncbi:hypothetical protein Tco_1172632 [Tanacetum coccineum]